MGILECSGFHAFFFFQALCGFLILYAICTWVFVHKCDCAICSNPAFCSCSFSVDATKETDRLGRLINHSKCGNCQTKLHDIDGVPHLILIASRDIKAGEELLYDYGDRSKASIEAHPWLKH